MPGDPDDSTAPSWTQRIAGCASGLLLLLIVIVAAPSYFENPLRAKIRKARSGLESLVQSAQVQAEDPFRPGNSFQKTIGPGGRITAWSVGPDEIDQHGQLEYDPTNGLLSTGDIVKKTE